MLVTANSDAPSQGTLNRIIDLEIVSYADEARVYFGTTDIVSTRISESVHEYAEV